METGTHVRLQTGSMVIFFTASLLTSQVLVHHIRAVFHEEAEQGGSARAPLQPEQDRGCVSVGLRVRQTESEFSAPPSGDNINVTYKCISTDLDVRK